MHLIELVQADWVISSWIMNEFENFVSKFPSSRAHRIKWLYNLGKYRNLFSNMIEGNIEIQELPEDVSF